MESIIKNDDGTLFVDDMLYRPVKNTAPKEAADSNMREAVLLSLMKGLQVKRDRKKYPNSIFWFKRGVYMFDYDEKENYFWCSYSEVWSIFEKEFGMNFHEIEALCRTGMEKYFKLSGVKANYAPQKFLVQVERHFKEP